jgi:hypothetical protein
VPDGGQKAFSRIAQRFIVLIADTFDAPGLRGQVQDRRARVVEDEADQLASKLAGGPPPPLVSSLALALSLDARPVFRTRLA